MDARGDPYRLEGLVSRIKDSGTNKPREARVKGWPIHREFMPPLPRQGPHKFVSEFWTRDKDN